MSSLTFTHIREALAQGETQEVISLLKAYVGPEKYQVFQDELTLIEIRWNNLQRDIGKGLLLPKERERAENEINNSLLSLINRIESFEKNGAIPGVKPKPSGPKTAIVVAWITAGATIIAALFQLVPMFLNKTPVSKDPDVDGPSKSLYHYQINLVQEQKTNEAWTSDQARLAVSYEKGDTAYYATAGGMVEIKVNTPLENKRVSVSLVNHASFKSCKSDIYLDSQKTYQLQICKIKSQPGTPTIGKKPAKEETVKVLVRGKSFAINTCTAAYKYIIDDQEVYVAQNNSFETTSGPHKVTIEDQFGVLLVKDFQMTFPLNSSGDPLVIYSCQGKISSMAKSEYQKNF